MKKTVLIVVSALAVSTFALSGCMGATEGITTSILKGIGIKQKGPMHAKLMSLSAQTLMVNEDEISIPGTLTSDGSFSIWKPIRNSNGSSITCTADGPISLINTTCQEGGKMFFGRDRVSGG